MDVCKDGNSTWAYDAESLSYSRTSPDGVTIGRLKGEYLPNPDALWKGRCDARGVATTSIDGMKLRPQDATYALWNHWQGVKNANNDT